MEQIIQKAYAKINIGLDVLRRREDGYHELKMIMQTVDLGDDLVISRTDAPGIVLETECREIPSDGSNLICRAAELLLREQDIEGGVKIALTKRIPVAAGMAGGSADAAAAMRGINELFGLDYSVQELQRLGVRLGADIPYCLVGGTMLSEGIGEILTPLPSPPDCFLVIAKPDINVSTAFVYSRLRIGELTEHPDIDGMVRALYAGSLSGITDRLGNVLETVTVKEYPVIAQIKERLCGMGAENALMSGSGPSVFGIFTDRDSAQRAAAALKAERFSGQICVTTFKRDILQQ